MYVKKKKNIFPKMTMCVKIVLMATRQRGKKLYTMGEEKMQKKKTLFIHSISAKVMLLVLGVVMLAIIGSISNASSKSKTLVEAVNEDYILSLAQAAAEVLNVLPEEMQNAEGFTAVLSDIKMKSVSSSYTYLVGEDGTMLYHPTADKIGSPVENDVVKSVVAQLQSGKKPEDSVVLYEFKGAWKYAAYAVNENNEIVVVTADQDEIVAPVNQMVKEVTLISLSSLAICLIVGYIVSFFPVQTD